MDATEARQANLLDLERQHGTLEALAEKTESSAAHLSQIKNGTRNMGRDVARRFERKLELPQGWMDTREHGATQKLLAAPALVADFEVLPPALQDHVSAIARDLRERVEKIPPHIRKVISAPPKDPARYAEWESSIKALIQHDQK